MDAQQSKIPRNSRVVRSSEDFIKCAEYIGHFVIEVSEGCLYHFIVTSWRDVWNKVQEYYIAFKNTLIQDEELTEKFIEECISTGKLYVVDAHEYPKTEEERKEANERFWNRACKKLEYECQEHLSYVLTGRPFSILQSINSAGPWKYSTKKFSLHDDQDLKREMLMSAGCFLVSVIFSSRKEDVHLKAVSRKKDQDLPFPELAILETSNENLKRVAKETFIKAGIYETFNAGKEIFQLKLKEQEGMLSKTDFNRGITKSVAGAVGGVIGSVCSGVLGEVFNPGEGLESASARGGEIGRLLASEVAGWIFDDAVKRLK